MMNNLVYDTHKDFLNLLIKGDHAMCSDLVQDYVNNKISIQVLYENIIKKALYDVGELWEFNKISVATEHLASAIVEAILNELYPKIVTKEKNNKKVIFTCVENEFHQIGLKMVNDVFEMNDWITYFLGANTPTRELIDFIKATNPDLLAISLSIYFHLPNLEKLIQLLRNEFPDLQILVGGQAFRIGGVDIITKYANVIYKPDLKSTELFIKSLNS